MRTVIAACLAATASALVAPAAFPAIKSARQIVTAPQMVRFRVRNVFNRGDRRPFFGWLRFFRTERDGKRARPSAGARATFRRSARVAPPARGSGGHPREPGGGNVKLAEPRPGYSTGCAGAPPGAPRGLAGDPRTEDAHDAPPYPERRKRERARSLRRVRFTVGSPRPPS